MKSEAKNIPPRLAQRLVEQIIRHDLVEEVLGDLDEKFAATASSKSLVRARLNYWYQVFNYLRPFELRKSKSIPLVLDKKEKYLL